MRRTRARTGPRPIRQERAGATLDALVAAGERLLDGRDPEAIAMDDLLARAGASASSFYQRFGSKEQFVDHLHARFCDHIAGEFAAWSDPARFAGWPLEDFARAGVEAYVAFRRRHVGALVSFEIVEGRRPHLLERRRRVDLDALAWVRRCVATLRARDGRAPRVDRLDMAIDLVVSIVRGAADGAHRAHARRGVPDAELVEQVVAAAVGFLLG